MIIKNIELTNFRNYDSQKLFFDKGINVLVGKNAQGKTNMLEAIFLLTIGKSPRTAKEKEMIKWDCTYSKITMEISKLAGNKKIEMFLFANQNKAIKINSFSIKKIVELIGEVNSIYFSPDELKLVKSSPEERRRFLDITLCQLSKNYFYNINKYNRVLMQRNKLLKSTNDYTLIDETVSIWDEQLASIGSKIICERLELIKNLKKYVTDIYRYISNKEDELMLDYIGYNTSNEYEIKQQLLTNLKNNIEKDTKLGYTSVGPHRDDLGISLSNINVRSFGSQGEQRTVALCLKLAELEIFKEATGEYPILLLDDVLSELDLDRQQKLLEKVKDIQTFITCTNFKFDIECKKFYVTKGKINEEIIYED